MKQGKLRIMENGRVAFYCPGCKKFHAIHIEGEGRWDFNRNYNRPTFNPSILVRSGHFVPGHEDQCWCKFYAERPDEEPAFKCFQCHSFVADGKIQFLTDCSHELAGKIVELPDIED